MLRWRLKCSALDFALNWCIKWARTDCNTSDAAAEKVIELAEGFRGVQVGMSQHQCRHERSWGGAPAPGRSPQAGGTCAATAAPGGPTSAGPAPAPAAGRGVLSKEAECLLRRCARCKSGDGRRKPRLELGGPGEIVKSGIPWRLMPAAPLSLQRFLMRLPQPSSRRPAAAFGAMSSTKRPECSDALGEVGGKVLDRRKHPRPGAGAGCRIRSSSGALFDGGEHSGGRPMAQPVRPHQCVLWVVRLVPSQEPANCAPQSLTLAELGHQGSRNDMMHVALPEMRLSCNTCHFESGPPAVGSDNWRDDAHGAVPSEVETAPRCSGATGSGCIW